MFSLAPPAVLIVAVTMYKYFMGDL